MGDALDFGAAIGALIAGVIRAFLPGPEINPAGQFAHDQNIQAGNHFGSPGRFTRQTPVRAAGPQIGLDLERLAPVQHRPVYAPDAA